MLADTLKQEPGSPDSCRGLLGTQTALKETQEAVCAVQLLLEQWGAQGVGKNAVTTFLKTNVLVPLKSLAYDAAFQRVDVLLSQAFEDLKCDPLKHLIRPLIVYVVHIAIVYFTVHAQSIEC